jgi:hypothetical protein
LIYTVEPKPAAAEILPAFVEAEHVVVDLHRAII